MQLLLFTIILFLSSIGSAQIKLDLDEMLYDAQSSFLKGDLFSSYRYYLIIVDKKPYALTNVDINNLVSAAHIVVSSKEFEKFCKDLTNVPKLKDMASFQCGKTLMKIGKYEEAQKYFNQVSEKFLTYEVAILKNSNIMNYSQRQQCLNEIEKYNFTKLSPDEIQLKTVTEARCKLLLSKYAESIQSFNQLSTRMSYYLFSLEEQAWAQFKRRDLESTKELITALLVIYESKSNSKYQTEITDGTYFETRYLKAYVELLNKNMDKSKKLLTELYNDLKKYKLENKFNADNVKTTIKLIMDVDSVPKLQSKQYTSLGLVRNHVASWATVDYSAKLDERLRFLIAINKEIKRIRGIQNDTVLSGYMNLLLKLKKDAIQTTAQTMYAGVKAAERAIESLQFKANMGQLENYWAQQTEGKRTLADVIEDYKYGIMQVEDYLGK